MLYAELSLYRNGLPRPLACARVFGWLSAERDFAVGSTPPEIVEKLRLLAKRFAVASKRPVSACPQCGATADGTAEIWVHDASTKGYFVAPEQLIHYIDAHSYRPPIEVMSAVERMDVGAEGPSLEKTRDELVQALAFL